MDDKKLLFISLVSGAMGLIALFIIIITTDIQEISPFNMDDSQLDQQIKIKGTVERVTQKEKVTFIDIATKETVTAVAFENISLQKGSFVEIIGTLKEYNGKKEIVAEEITKTKN